MILESILFLIAIPLIVAVLGLLLPFVISNLIDHRLHQVEHGILALSAQLDAANEQIVTIGEHSNQLNFQVQTTMYAFKDHMIRNAHGVDDGDGILRLQKQPLTEQELLRFRQYGFHLQQLGQSHGWSPRNNNTDSPDFLKTVM